nr:TIR domain-containing protein [Nitrosomonas sp.]
VRNMGIVEGQPLLSDHDWEEVEKGGDKAIEKWIDDQMTGKSCIVVLIGKDTASRKWVKHEIKKAWDAKKGVVGIYIHNLKNKDGEQTTQGSNPFDNITVDGKKLSSIVNAHNPPYSVSTNVYDHIKSNIDDWVEKAIEIRSGNKA